MKEENKYYTPDIEEFHIGFEFESDYILFVNYPNTWTKVTLATPDHDWFWGEYIADAVPEEFRVKYLDDEDLKECGFTRQLGGFQVKDKVNYHHTYHYGGYAITRCILNNKLDIYYMDGSELVNGAIVKNKSELKKVLNMLGI